ncbi:MAG TPA: hypothetical protein VFU86_20385 [Terriglobales bacterium]|nr:hypothetical protein [Terriglobales bacterium]
MNTVNRRGFMKSFLASAAGISLVNVAAPGPLAGWTLDDEGSYETLSSGDQQLRVSPPGRALAFQNFVRAGSEWKPATLAGVPVVTGPSFSLMTSRAVKRDSRLVCEGSANATGVNDKPLHYNWNTEIESILRGESSWLRFRTTLHLPAPLKLQQGSRIEPQIILWLNHNSTLMEGQSGSWRRVHLQQPTRNSLGAPGNDLPALYLLDNNEGVETIMFFDVGDMAWMSFENLPRFLVYRCSMTSHLEPGGENQRFGVGLIADQAAGNVLPAGDVRLSYWLLQRSVKDLLNEREAVARWMSALLPLFEERLEWPGCATSWRELAANTVHDLQEKGPAQVEVNGHVGLRAYVKGSSQLWTQPANDFELMTVSDVLWPSLLYLRLHDSPSYRQECDELVKDLPGFYRADTHSISNNFKATENERADSWYPYENALIKYPTIGLLAGSKEITDRFLDAFQTAIRMAHHYDYLFPVYYRVATFKAEGAGTNYAVNGLFAWATLIAHRLTGEERYRDEARRAIQVLNTVPADRLFHEPQELAYGALAAAELGMKDEATYLLFEQLRMFYWYSDPSQKTHDIRGMVQAAASILYPAFKENVEAILPWTGIMKRGIVIDSLLSFMDQQRRNNFSFFEKCSQAALATGLPFIPFENLGTLELGGQTGKVGKEIYGAGECLWMYLMFEALGRVTDRELMLVNLDLVDSWDVTAFPPRRLNFIVFNPTSTARTGDLTIPPAGNKPVRLSQEGTAVSNSIQVPPKGVIRLVAEFQGA